MRGEVDYGWPDVGGFVGEFGDVFLSFEVCEGLGFVISRWKEARGAKSGEFVLSLRT